VKFLLSNIKKGEHINSPFDFYLNKYFQIIFQFAPTRLRTFPALYPLFATIFLLPTSKPPKGQQKGFSLQSGVKLQSFGCFPNFWDFLDAKMKSKALCLLPIAYCLKSLTSIL
jgi:hypothetical protein